MLTKEQRELYNEWERDELSDGEALDELLSTVSTSLPDLCQAIIDTDGDELTDKEALSIIFLILSNLAIKGQ